MTDYDYTSWQFLDAIGQASPLQDEAMSLAFEFPLNGNGPLSLDNCLPYGQTSAKQGYMHTHSHSPPIEMGMGMEMGMEMEMFAQGMEFISVPPFPDLNLTLGHSHGKKAPDTHDLSLLRSTSQNAAERALFMTPSVTSPSSSSSSSSNQHSSPSLDLDPCTPSTTSTSSKESDEDCDCEWDHPTRVGQSLHFYKLPDRLSLDSSFQAVPRPPRNVHHPDSFFHHHRVNNHRDSAGDEANAEELTPLEMPDGSTRFTANWLPVDPTGGFTIGIEEGRSVSVSAPASAMEIGYGYGHGHGHGHGQQDPAYGYGYADPVSMELEFSKEAFIQMPAPV